MSEEWFVPGEEGWAQCGGCGDSFPRTEQYGHFQSCSDAQNMAQVLKLLKQGQARVERERRAVEKEERSRVRKQEAREREARRRDGKGREKE